MAKYYLTNKAVQDLSNIWNYTFDEWSEHQADKYYRLLINNCKEISINPKVGKSYIGIADCLFGYKAGRHIIFYRIIEEEIEITRILHEKMDLKKRIAE